VTVTTSSTITNKMVVITQWHFVLAMAF
jgi:hypothetical protein